MSAMADELVTLLVRLVGAPSDLEVRRRAAELLDQRGLYREALALTKPLVNFTGHEDGDALPCLCKACIDAAGEVVEARGLTFHRAFAISGDRVLHYWLVDELAEVRIDVRRSVGEVLRIKLHARAR